jgi:hypothetical protein
MKTILESTVERIAVHSALAVTLTLAAVVNAVCLLSHL